MKILSFRAGFSDSSNAAKMPPAVVRLHYARGRFRFYGVVGTPGYVASVLFHKKNRVPAKITRSLRQQIVTLKAGTIGKSAVLNRWNEGEQHRAAQGFPVGLTLRRSFPGNGAVIDLPIRLTSRLKRNRKELHKSNSSDLSLLVLGGSMKHCGSDLPAC